MGFVKEDGRVNFELVLDRFLQDKGLYNAFDAYETDDDRIYALNNWLDTVNKDLDPKDYPVSLEWLEKTPALPKNTTIDPSKCEDLREYYDVYIYPIDLAQKYNLDRTTGFMNWLKSNNYKFKKEATLKDVFDIMGEGAGKVGWFKANFRSPAGWLINGLESTESGK